jgi:hypothetical protein
MDVVIIWANVANSFNTPASDVHSVLHAATAGAVDGSATVGSSSQKMLLEPHIKVCRGHARVLEAALIPGQ